MQRVLSGGLAAHHSRHGPQLAVREGRAAAVGTAKAAVSTLLIPARVKGEKPAIMKPFLPLA